MISPKPYLVRAIYEWCQKEQWTPYIVVQLGFDGVDVPEDFASDNHIVFDIAEDACEFLEFGDEWVSFNAEFDGSLQKVVFPVQAISGIYAKENTKGLFFDPADDEPPSSSYGQQGSDVPLDGDDDFEIIK